MTLTPDEIGGLIGWFDASYIKRMWSEDLNSPCAHSDSYLRWVNDRYNATMVWGVDGDAPGDDPVVVLSFNPTYEDNGIRFRIDAGELLGPNMVPHSNTLDDVFTYVPGAVTPAAGCGDLISRTLVEFTTPSCWTAFSVFKIHSIITPYPIISAGGRANWAPCLSSNLNFGLAIAYTQDHQTPKLLAHTGGNQQTSSNAVLTTLPEGRVVVAEASQANGIICLWVNGTLAGTGFGGIGGFSTGSLFLGGQEIGDKSGPGGINTGLPHGFGDYSIYETLTYNTSLNNATRNEIRAYLAGKWGVSVDPNSTGECELCNPTIAGQRRPQATLIGAT